MIEGSHTYTRKQLASWVQSHTKYKYEQLKNGVFFCKMLSLKFQEDVGLLKYNQNPISQYDCTSNLNLMKKVLNKRGLQPNLNIQTVLTSKNNFELAKWFKSLFQSNQSGLTNNYSSVPRQSIQSFRELPIKKSQQETPRKQSAQQKEDKMKKKIESAQKSSKNSLSKIKRLSTAKSEAVFLKQKRMLRSDLKIPIARKLKKQENQMLKYYDTQTISKQIQSNEVDDINDILYERALEQSIYSLSKILDRVKIVVTTSHPENLSQYKKQIANAIFTK